MKATRGSVVFLLALVALPASLSAQAGEEVKRQGYVFAAPGALVYDGEGVATLEAGGGFQWLVYRGLGLGFDGSWMGFPECFSCGSMWLGSVDASYHFVRSSRKLAPFILGGIGGLATGEGSVALGSFGGGINYWFENGMALRVEVRDRFDGEGAHILGVRVGVTF
jgi:hypothetical protein